jgi:hypothetical protein
MQQVQTVASFHGFLSQSALARRLSLVVQVLVKRGAKGAI